jgi:hypothetical protein
VSTVLSRHHLGVFFVFSAVILELCSAVCFVCCALFFRLATRAVCFS